MNDETRNAKREGFTRRGFVVCGTSALVAGCAGQNSAMVTPSAITSTEGATIQTGAAATIEPVKVALLLPTSKPGEAGAAAADLRSAAELAVTELTQPRLRMLNKDTEGTPAVAAAAAEAAIAGGAELILGPLFATEVAAVAPVARKAGVPVVAFSSDRKVAGQGVHLLSFLAGDDVPRILGYAAASGKRRLAALIPRTPYGKVIEASLKAAAPLSGMKIAALEHYALDADGMVDPMARIRAIVAKGGADALMVPGGSDTLPMLAPLLAYNGIDGSKVKLIGTSGWDFPGAGQEKALQSGWFPGADPDGWRAFSARFQQMNGRVPMRIASLGYDAVSLAAALCTAPKGERFAEASLTRASGFAGIDGLFRLKPDGTSERGLAILEVQPFGAKVIDPAPSSFGTAGF